MVNLSFQVHPILTDHRIVVLYKMLDACDLAQNISAIRKRRSIAAQQIVQEHTATS